MDLRILRILLYILILLIFLETVVEIRAYFRGYDTILFGKNVALKNQNKNKTADLKFGPNELFPFRSPISTVQKSSGVIRIWIASSSFTEDIYLPVEKIYPTILGELLNRNEHKFDILNAAHAGENIYRNCLNLQELGPVWKPDYVLLYQMTLEISLISRIVFGNEIAPLALNESTNNKTSRQISWAQRTLEETTIYKHLKEYVTSILKRSKILQHTMGEEGEREFENLIRYFLGVCKRLNVKPILCTFATSHLKSDLPNLPLKIRNWWFVYNDYLSEKGCFDTLERFNKVITKIADEENCMLIDLKSEIGGRKEYFRDFVHFSIEGHRAVAELLYKSLNDVELK